MKNIVILGAGTSGTMMANHLAKKLPLDKWRITIVDQYKTHYYQAGFLFLPFDFYEEEDVKKNGKKFIPDNVNYILKKIKEIKPDENKVNLEDETLNYDILIIATGTKTAPEETEGMKSSEWYKSIFDFYTYEGAIALRNKLKDWEGGKMLIHITEMPIKCPVAPLEFAFLADAFFENKGIRDKVEITYVTPLDGAFTKPKATKALHYLLEEKGIKEVTNFNIERVDYINNKIIDYEGTEVEYDLLVTVPTNLGDEIIETSGLGDDMNYVPTNKATLQSKANKNIFVIGDASNVPASKAGSVAHFEAEILVDNIQRFIKGEPLKEEFDGHANCFIETGHGKALLIDFNYTHEPVEGTFPFPGIGPLKLLKESRMNHLGKLAFKWMYWNMLIKGIHIPFVSATMDEKGKNYND
jgi:sulfide:quinone oxidoreductase